MITSLEALQEQWTMSRAMRCRPSELARITDEWAGYFWDEACYQVSLYDLSKKKQRAADFGAFG